MLIAGIPLKYYVPFATSDSARVEIPVTTSDPTRASQSLGFPPLTMQPPESGGVPPQGEDFNGAMNQVARIAWWLMAGGPFPFDATFASNSNINGYPQGAILESSDYLGQWINTTDNNQVNPDTTGTGWVPGYAYGSTAVTGLTNANVTLTPLQAAKSGISLSGTLTGAVQIILPNWLKGWTITNSTTGAFTVTVKTAAGSGVVIPQTAQPTRVTGDGTNINQPAENIAAATQAANPVQLGQLNNGTVKGFAMITATTTFTAPVTGVYTISGAAPGGGGGGGGGTVGNTSSCGGGGGGGGGAGQSMLAQQFVLTAGAVITITMGAAGIGGTAGQGTGSSGGGAGAGGNLVFSSPVSRTLTGGGAGGGGGGNTLTSAAVPAGLAGGLGGTGFPQGQAGADGNYAGLGGQGAASPFGGGGGGGRAATATSTAQTGAPAFGYGGGGGGGGASYGTSAQAAGVGGAGAPGVAFISW